MGAQTRAVSGHHIDMAMPPDQVRSHVEVLARSADSAELTASAIALASSRDREGLISLGRVLRDAAFLGRLDKLDDPRRKVSNLRHIFAALERNPTDVTGRLCEVLTSQPGFNSVPERRAFLLAALAAVRPMSETAAGIFFTATTQGHFLTCGPLLVANGSKNALALFEEMVADKNQSTLDRVDLLHQSILSRRLESPVVELCTRLLDRPLEPPVRDGLIGTMFDYRPKEWFGIGCSPQAPPWNLAETPTLRFYRQLGQYLLGTAAPSPILAAAIHSAMGEINGVLAERSG